LTTKGLAVDGVNNCGSNVHRFKKDRNLMDESLLSFADVGASTIETTPISKMGEFKGRLLYSKQSIVGYGCNDSTISATTTAADGSPNWSMGDEALPLGFFDPKTAEFNDSIENRVRAKLMINFGNPFKDKRGDSIIPELYSGQRPPLRTNMSKVDISQGSPPHGMTI
jgi:integrator complex subunit 6